MRIETWQEAAIYCEENFGSFVNWTERYFICPECNEPIYEEDWEDRYYWDSCPVCECYFEEM